jgi:hypothetical protein
MPEESQDPETDLFLIRRDGVAKYVLKILDRHRRIAEEHNTNVNSSNASEITDVNIGSLIDFIEEFESRNGLFFKIRFSNFGKRSRLINGIFSGNFSERWARLSGAVENYIEAINDEYVLELARDTQQRPMMIEFGDTSTFRDEVRVLLKQLRALVRGADISHGLREHLLKQLSAIERDIEKEKTSYESFLNLMLETSYAISEGAKALEPAFEKIKELAAAFKKQEVTLRIEQEDGKKKLPPPTKNDASALPAPKKPE